MRIAPLNVIKKQDNYSELAAFLRTEQYTIFANGPDADILKLHKPLDERQELLLSLWLSVYAYDYKDTIIG
jgi:hypothetical protein